MSGLAFVGCRGRSAHVESVAFVAEPHAEPGSGDGNFVVERLTCGHFLWQRFARRVFKVQNIAARIGKLRRCMECVDASVTHMTLSDIVLETLAASEKQTFGAPW